eukprot:c2937_g1_i1.p1 GENE.c2937_g1_i1~~c2937_g1_i1.p1  ORF type:complete len:299 (-),score=56.99 c2937_g1_i1:97-918(-)
MADPRIVKLNVGGTRYLTSRTTLLAHGPNFFSSLFVSMESYAIGPALLDELGYVFIDRNGRLFDVVLEFLRTGEVWWPQGVARRQIEMEFDFYQVDPYKKPPTNAPLPQELALSGSSQPAATEDIGEIVRTKIRETQILAEEMRRVLSPAINEGIKESLKQGKVDAWIRLPPLSAQTHPQLFRTGAFGNSGNLCISSRPLLGSALCTLLEEQTGFSAIFRSNSSPFLHISWQHLVDPPSSTEEGIQGAFEMLRGCVDVGVDGSRYLKVLKTAG